MTIDGESFLATESLLLRSPRNYYPAKVPVRHWQLRSLISSPIPNIVYYASDSDIYRIDTRTKKQQLIATLPFESRCLITGHGWLCVGGGENGQFATVAIDDHLDDYQPNAPQDLGKLSALLGLGLDGQAQGANGVPAAFVGTPIEDTRRRSLRTYELGGKIVNSVTLHRSPLDRDQETVAVLTNNDQTVRLFSLTYDRSIIKLDFPFAMNHAAISPRGDLLVAVGDDPTVFFYKRVSRPGDYSRWARCCEFPLQSGLGLPVVNDGCSATAFSPSGHLCAVALQDGIITVFDTALVDVGDPDPVVKLMPSSRSRTEPGAVRSMCFAPEPWDLLVCAEQSGRICVLDVRDRFCTRQVVSLTTEPGNVQRWELVEDFAGDETIDPRLRSDSGLVGVAPERVRGITPSGGAAAASFAFDFNEAAAERRRLQRLTRDHSPEPFSEREREILDALRSSRERNEARERPVPMSIQYSRDAAARSAGVDFARLPAVVDGSAVDRRHGLRPWTQATAGIPSLRDYLLNPQRDRIRSRNYEPGRYGSIAPAGNDYGTTSAVRELPSPTAALDAGSASSSRLSTEEAADPWQTIEAAMASDSGSTASPRWRLAGEASMEASFQRRQEIHSRLEQRRREQLRTLYAEVEGMGREPRGSLMHADREPGLGTAGCAISCDGRKLYIGIEEGILEYYFNIQARKFFPENTPR